MPKEIPVGRKPTQQELLARATGQQRKMMPPPQQKGLKLPPGVTGDLPLPTGKVVGGVPPSAMTPQEREALDAVGWTPDVPVPTNMADILEGIRREKAAEAEEVVLPVDPRTPPPKFEPMAIKDLKPDEQKRILGAMKEATEQQEFERAAAREQAKMQARDTSVPGLGAAYAAAAKAAQGSREPVVEDDRDEPDKAKPQPDVQPPAVKSGFEDPKSETGADARPADCPHCGWNLAMPDVEEPDYADKLSFLHALLGQKVFVKDWELFGGNVVATFRTLTTQEIDVVYRQAWRDREMGKVMTEIDYWERINRYRLFLQLQCLKSLGPDGFVHDLPDGLSAQSNPQCTATWKVEEPIDPNETPLPFIEEYLVTNVLKTEAVFRVVNMCCNRFNRLVAKLEAMADNSDFWRPTGEPS